MGFIRGSLVVIASVLLFLCFLAGNFFLTINKSLEYENVQPELSSYVEEIAEVEVNLTKEINQSLEVMEEYCQNHSEYVFSEGSYVFDISCESIEQGTERIIDEGINETIEEIYYDDYDCSFLDCFTKEDSFFILASAKVKKWGEDRFYLTLIAIVILITLMFLLIENKTNLPILVGILLIIASLPFMKLHALFSFLPEGFFLSPLLILISKSYSVFLLGCILGIIILGIGILLKFFKLGFKIAALFSKKGKEIPKKDEKIPKEKKISKKGFPKTKKKESK